MKLFTQYLWQDEPFNQNGLYAGWQSGLLYLDGRAKPALKTFKTPFVLDSKRSRLWGQVRSRETRTVKAVTVQTPGGIAFPHAEQAVRITRTRVNGGKTSRETAYLTVSLPAGQALPTDLQTWIRRHRHIENMIHYVRA